MIRGTTPTYRLTVSGDIDFSITDHVYVAFKQGSVTVELSDDELTIDGNVITCYLTQEKSLRLVEGAKAEIQVNWTYPPVDGVVKRAATVVKEITIGKQLIRRVLPDA